MTDNDDDLDKNRTTKMIWTMTTSKKKQQKEQELMNMLTTILQMIMRASDMSSIK